MSETLPQMSPKETPNSPQRDKEPSPDSTPLYTKEQGEQMIQLAKEMEEYFDQGDEYNALLKAREIKAISDSIQQKERERLEQKEREERLKTPLTPDDFQYNKTKESNWTLIEPGPRLD